MSKFRYVIERLAERFDGAVREVEESSRLDRGVHG